jgi:hypothetical protein
LKQKLENAERCSEISPTGQQRTYGIGDRHRYDADTPLEETMLALSLLHRSPERSLIPLSAGSAISQIVWSPLAQGVLTGKYLPGGNTPPDSRAANDGIGTCRGDGTL